MGDRLFELQPFISSTGLTVPNPKPIPQLKITTNLKRTAQYLTLSYQVQGELSQIILPSVNNQPERKDELWQTTCFEFFLAIFNVPEYWEFNLAPTGDWNIYRFEKYRRGMREETRINELPFKTVATANSYQLTVTLPLELIVSGTTPLEIAVSTVIEDKEKNLSYWAIMHPGAEADFHRRDSFVSI